MKLLIKPSNYEINNMYSNHSHFNDGDSGIDIFFVEDKVIPANSTVLVDFGISCEMRKLVSFHGKKDDIDFFSNKSYWLLPRSSIYKTPLRMSNSVGLIDAGYRGSLMVPVDNISSEDYTINKGSRLFQIATACLEPIEIVITKELSLTDRLGGFGSTGK